MDWSKIEHCVEALCQHGCRAVHGIIAALEGNQPVEGASHLNAAERSAVVSELKSIMAVYGDRCTID